VPPGDVVTVDDNLNLRIKIAAPAAVPAKITPTCRSPTRSPARGRPDRARDHVEPPGHRGRGDVADGLPHRLLADHLRGAGLRLRTARPEGETLAHSPRAMPVFNLTLPRAVKALLALFPPETLKPGDVLITNDPWLCAGHLFDIAIVTPVFRDGRWSG
jgi:5-oxoprolinase (ATP-hydrolysing)